MTLSTCDRCTKIYRFLDWDKYVSMGISSKAKILRVLSCKLKKRNQWLLRRKKEILKISHSYLITYSALLWLFRSELYCFGIRTKKIVLHCLFRLKTNYIRFNNVTLKNYLSTTFMVCYLYRNDHLFVAVVLLILLLQHIQTIPLPWSHML